MARLFRPKARWYINDTNYTIRRIGNATVEDLIDAIHKWEKKHGYNIAYIAGGENLGNGVPVAYTIILESPWIFAKLKGTHYANILTSNIIQSSAVP